MKKNKLALPTLAFLCGSLYVRASEINETPYTNSTPLMTALTSYAREPKNSGYKSVFYRTLEKTSVEALNEQVGAEKTTPLLEAVRFCNPDITQKLVAAGANPSLKNADGDDAFMVVKNLSNCPYKNKIVRALSKNKN